MARSVPPRPGRPAGGPPGYIDTAVLEPPPVPWTPGRAGTPRDDPPTEPFPVVPGPLPVVPGPGRSGWAAWPGRFGPAAWRGARVDPGRPGATALALVAAVAAVLAAVGVWTERPQSAPVPALPAVVVSGADAGASPGAAAGAATGAVGGVATGPAGGASTGAGAGAALGVVGVPTAGGAAAAAGLLVVSVSGRVRRPGLVRVPDGARVADVVLAAGGALPGTDLTRLNLARRVADGEQVAVGVPAAPVPVPALAPEGSASPAAGTGPVGKIDLNAATAAQLDGLPGIGAVTVARILEWRTRNGRFARVDQLREIDGIGERRFAQLRDLVTVG